MHSAYLKKRHSRSWSIGSDMQPQTQWVKPKKLAGFLGVLQDVRRRAVSLGAARHLPGRMIEFMMRGEDMALQVRLNPEGWGDFVWDSDTYGTVAFVTHPGHTGQLFEVTSPLPPDQLVDTVVMAVSGMAVMPPVHLPYALTSRQGVVGIMFTTAAHGGSAEAELGLLPRVFWLDDPATFGYDAFGSSVTTWMKVFWRYDRDARVQRVGARLLLTARDILLITGGGRRHLLIVEPEEGEPKLLADPYLEWDIQTGRPLDISGPEETVSLRSFFVAE